MSSIYVRYWCQISYLGMQVVQECILRSSIQLSLTLFEFYKMSKVLRVQNKKMSVSSSHQSWVVYNKEKPHKIFSISKLYFLILVNIHPSLIQQRRHSPKRRIVAARRWRIAGRRIAGRRIAGTISKVKRLACKIFGTTDHQGLEHTITLLR